MMTVQRISPKQVGEFPYLCFRFFKSIYLVVSLQFVIFATDFQVNPLVASSCQGGSGLIKRRLSGRAGIVCKGYV